MRLRVKALAAALVALSAAGAPAASAQQVDTLRVWRDTTVQAVRVDTTLVIDTVQVEQPDSTLWYLITTTTTQVDSVWVPAETRDTTPEPEPEPPPEGVLFADGFEDHPDQDPLSGRGGNGFSWGSDFRARVVDAAAAGIPPLEGRRVLSFRHPPSDVEASGTNAEQRMRFPLTRSVWVEFWVYVPANYSHRTPLPSNNKFLQFHRRWSGLSGDAAQLLTLESEITQRRVDGGNPNSYMRRFLSGTDNCDGSQAAPLSMSTTPDFIGPSAALVPGEWRRIRVHYRGASACEVRDGYAAIWIGDVLFRDLTWAFWHVAPASGSVDGGYLLGWANSGFAEETIFYVDDFRIWVTDPGWD